MTAVDDKLVCAPGGSYSVASWGGYPSPPDPMLARPAMGITRVLVVGPDGDRVRWALTQVWRAAGRPIVVTHQRVERSEAAWRASEWAAEHRLAGVRSELADAPTAGGADVIVVCGWSAALRVAVPVARRAGIDVVDAATVEEFDR